MHGRPHSRVSWLRAARRPGLAYSALMVRWEYKFVELFRGTQVRGSTGFAAFEEEMQIAGEEGWEAVGEVAVSYHPEGKVYGYSCSLSSVLLKRPKD